MVECPICRLLCKSGQSAQRVKWYECPNCGSYDIAYDVEFSLGHLDQKARAVLSSGIWQRQRNGDAVRVTLEILNAAKTEELPHPGEQLDRFILYLGTHQESPGSHFSWVSGTLRAKLGALTTDDEGYIARAAADEELLDTSASHMQGQSVRLSMKGWRHFQTLQRGAATSRTAFMAMPFGDEEVVNLVENVFRPAVQETGFSLKRVDDEPQAGLIDNKIRVDIRLCRFLIADLTGKNPGAYWEAGFAEGLGKPVIYTCSKPHFDEHRTHFDTNHCQTVIWEPDNRDKAAENLKATIRATLPFEAKMPQEA